jgi:hypothetical protein
VKAEKLRLLEVQRGRQFIDSEGSSDDGFSESALNRSIKNGGDTDYY